MASAEAGQSRRCLTLELLHTAKNGVDVAGNKTWDIVQVETVVAEVKSTRGYR
jgi:hypothetical protein